jgi:hypothetical protein
VTKFNLLGHPVPEAHPTPLVSQSKYSAPSGWQPEAMAQFHPGTLCPQTILGA